jgi:excinuclease ABC subunit C
VEILTAFIPQFYLSDTHGRDIPKEIVVNAKLTDKSLFVEALSTKTSRKVTIADNVRSQRKRWVNIALTSAEQALGSHLANRNNIGKRFEALQEVLQLDGIPQRLECFDISHSSGEATVASCVVFDSNGPLKSDYRRFNIEGITPGDDYAAMSQALKRRYTRIKKGEGLVPDILFIDGGKGQLHEAEKVMEELQIVDVTLVGVAKGPGRKAGLEHLFMSTGSEISLPPDNPGLHLIQHIRDESHRFAITAHRNRRGKARTKSVLDGIDGVGPKRRRALLRHFGGSKQVQGASPEEIAKVESISQKLAAHIYDTFHKG